MFKKVLLAEDFQGANDGVIERLKEDMQVAELQEELYCDKALSRIKVALKENKPFQLLITDLYFGGDHTPRKITSGEELIQKVRGVQPNIKIIAYSQKDNPVRINTLFKDLKIDAYVLKGRHGQTELIQAVQEVFHNRTYVSPSINLSTQHNVFKLDEFDRAILKELAEGLTKKEISNKFKKENRTPNSESTIDKKISRLYDEYGAKNTTSLLFKLAKEGKI